LLTRPCWRLFRQGYLVSYQLNGYPAVLEPVLLPYWVGQVAQ